MDKPWYRKMLNRSHPNNLTATQRKAEGGDADAQFNLALRYSIPGSEQTVDYPKAAQWYLRAAEQGHALAQFNLGTMYAAGQGVEFDLNQAVLWFERAASQGDPGAKFH